MIGHVPWLSLDARTLGRMYVSIEENQHRQRALTGQSFAITERPGIDYLCKQIQSVGETVTTVAVRTPPVNVMPWRQRTEYLTVSAKLLRLEIHKLVIIMTT